MVKAQVGGAEFPAAVLAEISIACVDVSSVEGHGLSGKAIVGQDANDSRNSNLETDGTNPFMVSGAKVLSKAAQFGPIFEVVGGVPTVFGVNNLRHGVVVLVLLEEKRKCPSGRDHSHRRVVCVEQ